MIFNLGGRVDRLYSYGMNLFFIVEKKFEVLSIRFRVFLVDLVFVYLFILYIFDRG